MSNIKILKIIYTPTSTVLLVIVLLHVVVHILIVYTYKQALQNSVLKLVKKANLLEFL